MSFRIGFGYDIHDLRSGHEFVVGGLSIPHYKGAVGHSDADVLIHAICDAFLGAASLDDIGRHFPNTSLEFKNIDSKILLKKVVDLITAKGYSIGNIDSTICLEKPMLALYIPEMRKVLAEVMGIGINDISIKATTTEKLGFVGREEGIAAYAVVLLKA